MRRNRIDERRIRVGRQEVAHDHVRHRVVEQRGLSDGGGVRGDMTRGQHHRVVTAFPVFPVEREEVVQPRRLVLDRVNPGREVSGGDFGLEFGKPRLDAGTGLVDRGFYSPRASAGGDPKARRGGRAGAAGTTWGAARALRSSGMGRMPTEEELCHLGRRPRRPFPASSRADAIRAP